MSDATLSQLWRVVKGGVALLQDLVHDRGGRGADAERADAPAQRQRDELVARGGAARALGGAADRPQVLGVLHLIERQDQRVLPCEQLRGLGVGVRAGTRAHPLVGCGAAAALYLIGARDQRAMVAEPGLAGGALGR